MSINIFPADLRGRIREGQWPMESGNIMTNAVVTQYVSAIAGRTPYLKYQDGTATIAAPPETQVRRLTLSTLGDLQRGLRVTVRGTAEFGRQPDRRVHRHRAVTLRARRRRPAHPR